MIADVLVLYRFQTGNHRFFPKGYWIANSTELIWFNPIAGCLTCYIYIYIYIYIIYDDYDDDDDHIDAWKNKQ